MTNPDRAERYAPDIHSPDPRLRREANKERLPLPLPLSLTPTPYPRPTASQVCYLLHGEWLMPYEMQGGCAEWWFFSAVPHL